MQYKNLDEVASKSKIWTDLKEQSYLEELRKEFIKSLEGTYGDTQRATVQLPMEAAQKLLLTTRKILREQTSLKRCFESLVIAGLLRISLRRLYTNPSWKLPS